MLFSYLVCSVCGRKQAGQEGRRSAEETVGEPWIPGDTNASWDTSESWCLALMLEKGILSLTQEPLCQTSEPTMWNWKPWAIPASIICIVSVLAPPDTGLPIFLYRYLLIFPAICIDWDIWNTAVSVLIKESFLKRAVWVPWALLGQKISYNNHFWRHTYVLCACSPKCTNTYSCYIFLSDLFLLVYSHWSDCISPEGIKEDTTMVFFLVFIFYFCIVSRKTEFPCFSM